MAPEITMQYFDDRGRAESTRLALLLGDVSFKDDRVASADWKTVKPTTPFGAMPVLHVDGEAYAQSNAMLRYAGKLSGLYPTDAKAALRVDMVLDTAAEMQLALFAGFFEDDKEMIREMRVKAVADAVPRLWKALDGIVGSWNTDGPFVLGEKVSVADLAITEMFNTVQEDTLDFVAKDTLDGCERLLAVQRAVLAIPAVVEWYKKYPIAGVTTKA